MRFTLSVLLVLTVGLVACASQVELAKVEKFGKAAADASTALQEVEKAQRLLADQSGQEIDAAKYSRRSQDFSYPPTGLPAISGELWGPRIQLVAGLKAYADGLASASSPDNVAKVDTGLASLVAAVKSVAPASAQPALAAGGEFGRSVASILVSRSNAAYVHQTIVAADPVVRRAVDLLISDLDKVSAEAQGRFAEYIVHRKGTLGGLANDRNGPKAASGASPVELYDTYNEFWKQDSGLRASIATLLPDPATGVPPYRTALLDLARAHAALAKGGSSDVAIDQFITAVQKLVALIKALQTA